MGLGTIFSIGWTLISRGLSRGGFRDTAEVIAKKLVDLKDAESEVAAAEIEREIIQLKMISDIQRPQSARWWSPMQIGQYLVVGSFGVWFASVCLISVAKPLLVDGVWTVDDLPDHIFEMAWWLFPAIIVGSLLERRK